MGWARHRQVANAAHRARPDGVSATCYGLPWCALPASSRYDTVITAALGSLYQHARSHDDSVVETSHAVSCLSCHHSVLGIVPIIVTCTRWSDLIPRRCSLRGLELHHPTRLQWSGSKPSELCEADRSVCYRSAWPRFLLFLHLHTNISAMCRRGILPPSDAHLSAPSQRMIHGTCICTTLKRRAATRI